MVKRSQEGEFSCMVMKFFRDSYSFSYIKTLLSFRDSYSFSYIKTLLKVSDPVFQKIPTSVKNLKPKSNFVLRMGAVGQ